MGSNSSDLESIKKITEWWYGQLRPNRPAMFKFQGWRGIRIRGGKRVGDIKLTLFAEKFETFSDKVVGFRPMRYDFTEYYDLLADVEYMVNNYPEKVTNYLKIKWGNHAEVMVEFIHNILRLNRDLNSHDEGGVEWHPVKIDVFLPKE